MAKRRRRSGRTSGQQALWIRLRPERLAHLLTRLFDRRTKWVATGILALITVPLLAALALLGQLGVLYVLVLASVSLGLLLWALPDARLALAAVFLFTQPLLIYLGNSEYGYTKAVYSLGFISLLSVVWLGSLALSGRAELQLTRLAWPILLLVASAALSLMNAESLLGDLQYLVLLVYFALFYLFLANTVERPGQLRFLLGALLGAAALASFYGLLQYYDVVAGSPHAARGGGAMLSTFGNPNYLGGFVAYLYAPGLFLLFFARTRWTRLFALSASGLIYLTLVAVDSDSAWLAWLLSLAALLLGLLLARRLGTLVACWRWILALVGFTLLLATGFQVTTAWWVEPEREAAPAPDLAASVSASTPFLTRAESFARSPSAFLQAAGTLRARLEDWLVGVHMFKDHPVVGTGIGDYKREFLPYKAEFRQTELGRSLAEVVGYIWRAVQAHNEYVQILAELGILGLLGTAALIVLLLVHALGRLREATAPEAQWTVLALLGGVVAFMSDAVFSFPLHLPANALALVALVGLLHSGALGRPEVPLALRGRSLKLLAGVALALALTVSLFAYRDWRADIYLKGGIGLLAAGYPQGEALVQKSLELDFAPSEAYYWLGTLAIYRGEIERGKALIERSFPLFKSEFSYYLLALTNFQLREIEAARRYLDTLLAMDAHPILRQEARYIEALVLYYEGRVEEALAAFEGLLASDYQPEKMHLNLAEIYLDQDRPELAREHLMRSRELIRQELSELEQEVDESRSAEGEAELRLRRQDLERLQLRVTQLASRLSD